MTREEERDDYLHILWSPVASRSTFYHLPTFIEFNEYPCAVHIRMVRQQTGKKNRGSVCTAAARRAKLGTMDIHGAQHVAGHFATFQYLGAEERSDLNDSVSLFVVNGIRRERRGKFNVGSGFRLLTGGNP
jgi:hypothetical protein